MKDVEMMKAAREHVRGAMRAIADIQREFLRPFDPSESEKMMQFCREVAEAFDEVVLVIGRQKDNQELREMMKITNEKMIQNLIEYHNKNKETH